MQYSRTIGLAGAVAAALAVALAQSFPACIWLLCGGLVPLCLTLNGRDFRTTWLVLALFNGFYTLFTAHWIRLTGTGFGWFLAAAILYEMAWTVLPAGMLWCAAKGRSDTASLVFLPAGWMFMEAVSRRTLFGLSWALLGLPLADYPVLAQAASLAGPEIMSFLVIALNVSIVLAIRERTGKPLRLALAQGPGLLILAVIFGLLRLAGGSAAPPQRVAVVQPMLSQQIRWDNPENRLPSLARLNSLIDRATTPRPDLIVLPEGILPALLRYEPDLAGFATEAVRRSGIPMLLGSIDRDYLSKVYNVAFRIGIDGEVDQYRKRRLVPFVEETPWPFRYRPADGWVQFSPGNGSTLMPLGEGKQFAVLMCLEDTYPDLASEYAREGADLLVSMLNTENFRGTNQSLAHLRRARLTAVSAGLPMLRAGNSGISCSLDARGRMVAEVQPNLESAAQLPVSTARAATVYGSIGDAGVLSGLLAMVALEWLWIVERRRPVSFVPALRRRQDRVQQVS